MGQQGHLGAIGGQVVEGAHGHLHLIAHAGAVHQDFGRVFSSSVPVNLPIIEILCRTVRRFF
jgi:hypothetical protein